MRERREFMDNQGKPNARRKRVVGEGKGIEKKGEGLGIGPVGQNDKKPPQNIFSQQTHNQTSRPFGSSGQNGQRPVQNPFYQSSGKNQTSNGRPAGPNMSRPDLGGQQSQYSQRPRTSSSRPSRPVVHSSSTTQSTPSRQSTGSSFGGGGKILILLAVVAFLLFGGKNILFGGDSTTVNPVSNISSQTQSQNDSSGNDSLMNLLGSFMGSTGNQSAYDFSGLLSGLTGGNSIGNSVSSQNAASVQTGSNPYQQYFTTNLENNTQEADESVLSGSREKYTVIRGNNRDQITIMVYMCGADLESQNGMATSDLKEMINANLSDNINLIVFTGGARRWKNNVVSSSANQIYQIRNGSLTQLVKDAGNASMTSPSTLASFISFGKEHFSANRMCLIFWDHGGGSVSGYGYDERYGQGQTMTLAGINEALTKGGVKFDFIGFDTCLMATLENALMLNQHADYMIASEESEPGVGWYYTNWLNRLSKNTSMSTVQIGKQIVDDFVEVCDRTCRGQATTLSVVDLAELSATVPKELKEFSIDTNQLIQNKEYKKVSAARSKTREFAQHARIDQIDLVHFAKNMGTTEGKELASALQGAIKYNRTGGGISNAYGLSIYFPYKKTSSLSKALSTYKAIGMDDEYTRCIQEFASLELSGQLSGGSSLQSYSGGNAMSGLLESLMGGGSDSYVSIGNNYSQGGLESLLGGYFGGNSSGSTGSILDLLGGRSLTAESAAEYIQENHFDPSGLIWENGIISFSQDQMDNLLSIEKNLFFDDGNGYIDMGFDTAEDLQGNDLHYEFDGTWLSIDRQPVAYYRIGYVEQDTCYAEVGYVPAMVNGIRADLILVFDQENPYGYIAGAEPVYLNGETDTQAKNLVGIGEGDRIQFVCSYYDYRGNYQDTFYLGDPIVLGSEVEIGNTYVDAGKCRLTYCLTDIYQQHYWTPVV